LILRGNCDVVGFANVLRDFLQDEAFAGQDKVLARYLKPDLLIIDDM